MARRLLLLGSTGSIGTQALEILAGAGDELRAGRPVGRALVGGAGRAGAAHGVKRIALADADAAARAAEAWADGEVLVGAEGLVRLVVESDADLVLNALVGSAGLGPTVADTGRGHRPRARQQGVAGRRRRARDRAGRGDRRADHPRRLRASALHQLIGGEQPGAVTKLVLTASGGPFRGRTRAELETVAVGDALRHPTWEMGAKITIDSATLMNKGLELIEAHHLFGPRTSRSTSSCTRSRSSMPTPALRGAVLAHLGHPDMRVPISYALHYPERVDVPVAGSTWQRSAPDVRARRRRPSRACGSLARRRIAGGTAPCVLNAANEVAVHAFLEGRLGFLGIAGRDRADARPVGALTVARVLSLYEADHEARAIAGELVAAPRLMSWLLAFVGFAALIVLHEFGHFIAAKAVGMRVERFSLFFGPMLLKCRRGETEYGVGGDPARRCSRCSQPPLRPARTATTP